MPNTADPPPEVRDSPTYWFVVLDAARLRGQYDLAAEADRELRRLGVRVTYGRPGRPGEEAARED